MSDLMKENIVLLFENIETYMQQNRTAPPSQRLNGLRVIYRFQGEEVPVA